MRRLAEIFQWYRSRLANMSPLEIIHRVIELKRKLLGYRFCKDWNAFRANGTLAKLPGVDERWETVSTDLKMVIAEEATKVRLGQFHFLGASWHSRPTMPIDFSFWHLSPENTPWPGQKDYCFCIPFRSKLKTSEVKHVWEINRLQYLVPIAVDARLRGDFSAQNFIIDTIFSWMEGNRPYLGINWASGIEIALRAISVGLTISILGIERLDEGQRIQLERFFSAHAFWIDRYPSLYSSANNHRVAELVGLLFCVVLAPNIKNAKFIRKRAPLQILAEIERQILSDGVGAEQSPTYTAFTVELFLIALLITNIDAETLSDETRRRLGSWANQVQWMMDTTGQVPAIGDNDSGKVIALAQGPEPRYVASIVAAVAGYLQRPDLAPPRTDCHLRDIIFNSITSNRPVSSGLRTWDQGGYTVSRTRALKPIVLTFDHGPLGFLSIAAHGHADTLSIWLSVEDEQVIIDAGTYSYNIDPVWRARLRNTPSHNTLSIAGFSSSRSSGTFNWAKKTTGHLVSVVSGPPHEIIAEHDGYLNLFNVRHRRTISFVSDDSFTLTDELIGSSIEKNVAISFLINPKYSACVPNETGNVVMVRNERGEVLRLSGDGSLTPRIVRGDAVNGLGWMSPSFCVLIPTDQILFEGNLGKPSRITIDIL